MPLYMDFHIAQGITEEDMAMAHQMDLKVQDELNCKCLTYWFDKERGNAYCLIDAPNKAAAVEVHRRSHKQLPDEIIKVDKRVVKAFLGRVLDPKIVDYLIDGKIKVFNDSAFRVILNVTILPKKLLAHKLGLKRADKLLKSSEGVILSTISKHHGVAADSSSNEFIATFDSAMQAYSCALEIVNLLPVSSKDLDMRIAIHAGNPVDGDPELFGTTLKLSRFLCNGFNGNNINTSYTVKQLIQQAGVQLVDKKIRYLSATEEPFLRKLMNILHDNWQNPEFDMDAFCKAMSVSKSQLYRKCVNIANESPNKILRDFRLHQALKILETTDKNVSQTAFDSGFNNSSYFAKCFQKHYGLKPIRYKAIVTNE